MSTLERPVYVAALGASTAVGRDAPGTAAAVRASISGFTEHPFMTDSAGEPMRAAIASWLDINLQGLERFEALLFPAIDQVLEPLASTGADVSMVMAVGLPTERPGLPDDLAAGIAAGLTKRYQRRIAARALLENGHAAGFLGLQAAVRKMTGPDATVDACVVAGVDSYLSPETLRWLETTDQLHGAGTLNNAWGFIPGEGAGAVLLVTERALDRLNLEPLGQVLSVGRGFEQNRIKTQTVCIGEGLTTAFRDALSALPDGAKVTDVYCDMNGEPYRADEFGFAALRTKEFFESASDFIAPADCWGDVSAASASLGLVLASVAAKKSYAHGSYAFLWASSESGERGAALLAVRRAEVQ